MNKIAPRDSLPRRRVTIVLIVLIGASVVATIACWGAGTQLSSQYASGFTISLRTMPTFDGYSYQMYEIVPDSVQAAQAGSVPCILCIHGLGSSKEQVIDQGLTIAANGYVVLVPDTRGQNSHTGSFSFGVDDVRDLRDLITWVQASTHLPMVNKSNIGVFGHSMGALLVLLLAAQDPRVACTVEASGPSNMTRVLQTEWFRISLIGSPVDLNDPQEIARRTPLTYCNATNPRNLMIVHGRNDTSVPFSHSIDLNATVNPHGNRTDFKYVIYDSNHGLENPSPLNASRTCFQDALINATLWYDRWMKHDTSKTYSDVIVFDRKALAVSMNDAYKAMYIALLITTVFAFFVIVLALQFTWEQITKRIVRENTDVKNRVKASIAGDEMSTDRTSVV
jgi:dienelactone hydrolase